MAPLAAVFGNAFTRSLASWRSFFSQLPGRARRSAACSVRSFIHRTPDSQEPLAGTNLSPPYFPWENRFSRHPPFSSLFCRGCFGEELLGQRPIGAGNRGFRWGGY